MVKCSSTEKIIYDITDLLQSSLRAELYFPGLTLILAGHNIWRTRHSQVNCREGEGEYFVLLSCRKHPTLTVMTPISLPWKVVLKVGLLGPFSHSPLPVVSANFACHFWRPFFRQVGRPRQGQGKERRRRRAKRKPGLLYPTGDTKSRYNPI